MKILADRPSASFSVALAAFRFVYQAKIFLTGWFVAAKLVEFVSCTSAVGLHRLLIITRCDRGCLVFTSIYQL